MKRNIIASLMAVVAIGSFGAACGDDSSDDTDEQTDETPDDTDETPDDTDADADMTPDMPGPDVYTQIEFLGRPAIAEALLLTNDFLAGYNATAPSFAGVPPATLDMVVAEVKTVLQAVYHGVCLVNGVAGLTAETGFKPGGVQCARVGVDIFSDGATAQVLRADQVTAAGMYADKIFGQFIPDVLRIDTVGDSGYLTLCGDAASTPLLCGGRRLTDDTIDITYDYLLAGAQVSLTNPPTTGLGGQLRALVSDGVAFSAASSPNSLQAADPANFAQGHPAVTTTFPYSAPPQ